MDINEFFQGQYLKAPDVHQPRRMQIQAVTVVEMDGESKLAIAFYGESQQLLCNKTNAQTIAQFAGTNTDQWMGVWIECYAAPTTYQGRPTEGIRVRQAAAPPQQQAAPPQPPPYDA